MWLPDGLVKVDPGKIWSDGNHCSDQRWRRGSRVDLGKVTAVLKIVLGGLVMTNSSFGGIQGQLWKRLAAATVLSIALSSSEVSKVQDLRSVVASKVSNDRIGRLGSGKR